MTKSKTGRIEICDSRKKPGQFFVRYVGPNGKKLAHSECLTSPQNVNKNIKAMQYIISLEPLNQIENILDMSEAVDRTKSGWWAKKYGIEHKPAKA